MSYTPPDGDAVILDHTGTYTAPPGDTVVINFESPPPDPGEWVPKIIMMF